MASRTASPRCRGHHGHRDCSTELLEGRRLLAATVSLAADVNTDGVGSNPRDFTTFRDQLYFVADDRLHGPELWRYGGGAAAPVRVTDIVEGENAPAVSHDDLVVFNDALYFSAYSAEHGLELWKYDGTAASIAADIIPGNTSWPSASSRPRDLTVFNGALYFSAEGDTKGREIWRFDGAAASRVTDLNPGAGHAQPFATSFDFTPFRGALYFVADAGDSTNRLYRLEGQDVVRVDDVAAGPDISFSSSEGELTVFRDALYFTAGPTTDNFDRELWRFDGAAYTLAADVRPGGDGSRPRDLVVYDDALYFSAFGPSGQKFHRYDGSAATVAADVTPTRGYPDADRPYAVFAGDLYFTGTDSRLHRFDGAAATRVSGVEVGPDKAAFGNALYLSGAFRPNGMEFARSDGNSVTLVADLRPGTHSSGPSDFKVFNNQLYFAADSDASSHDELWKFDGASARIADPTRDYFQIEGPAVLNGRLYFTAANDDDDGWELWRYDGGRSTRVLGADDGFRIFPPGLYAFGGSLLFWGHDGERLGLWKFDGTRATFLAPLLASEDVPSHEPYGFTEFNGSLYFHARELIDGQPGTLSELWRYDGRGVARAPGIEPGSLQVSYGMAVLGGSLYFPARTTADSGAGEELWKYDGRSASLAADVLPGPDGSTPSDLAVLNGSLYFAAVTVPSPHAFGGELWRYDPATASATRLSEHFSSKPAYLTGLGDTLYFRADDDRDQPPGVWSYDGAAVRKAADLMLSNVGGFTLFRNALYFGADDGVHGFELWKIEEDAPPPPPAGRVVGRRVFYNNSAFDGSSTAADARDDAAVAPDKQALLPGQRASFMHYTSYARGLNGVMIDVRNLPRGTGLDRSDFQFKAGNSTNPATWANAPAPTRLVVRRGAGAGGSDRVTLVWADGAVANKWLQVTVRANSDTGLARADVFYFGNMIAETGDFARTAADVTAADVLRTAASQRRTPVGLDSRYDFDRNRRVDWADVAWARRALPTPPLRLFTAPSVRVTAVASIVEDEDEEK